MKRAVIGALALSCALGAAAFAQPGLIELPNAWKIVRPSGGVAATGTMPEGITLSQDGRRALVVEGGWGPNGLRTVDLRTLQTTSFVEMKSAFGRALRDANGDGVWVAGGSTDAIAHISGGAIDKQIKLDAGYYAVDVTRSPDGTLLAVVGESANKIAFIDEAAGAVIAQVDVGHHPRAAVFSQDGATLYVSNWGQRTVDRIDVGTKKNLGSIAVGMHPGAMVLDGTILDVAVVDDDVVVAIDTKTNTILKVGAVHGRGEIGWSPNNLRLVGDSLYVSCAAANTIVVLDAKTLAIRTSVPSGWYPTDAAVTADALYVLDGKGEGGHANPQFSLTNRAAGGYIAGNLVGSLRKLPIPSTSATPTRKIASIMRAQEPGPIVRANGPIKHIIYVIKENRTYDQILGDVKGADGDPSLVVFGRNVTPNEHAIVERFGIFDNFMDNAHVSADGHNWSMAAFANDYLEKMWPPNYSNRRKTYDFEDGAEASVPHAGYLWDLATRSHVTFRNYGEFVTEPAKKGGDYTTQMPNLGASTDPKFPTFDMAIKDVDRFAEWKREFDGYVAAKSLPQLEILRFPRDHTSGTRVGAVTPAGMVADNDRALGLLLETVSHSPYWRDTLIVGLEDDAQNGADHVDEQRSTFYLASAYAKPGVHHAHYTTSSVLHTIELILGMPSMSPYDAAALPLDAAFTTTPNLKPFAALATQIDTQATNTKAAYRASDSAKLDLAHADAADPGIMNDILWHSAHPGATPPPYGVFR
jgi:YVTN family beta-propeller protein